MQPNDISAGRGVILPEPTAREDKPGFDTLPRAIIQDIERLMGSAVTGGDTVYGGFSPSAGFRMSLQDGRTIFVKGTHPQEMAHGTAQLRQEAEIYRGIPILQKIAPRFHGVVGDGDEDGWLLGVFDHIAPHEKAATGFDMLNALELLQSRPEEAQHLTPATQQNFIEMFFTPDRKWQRLQTEEKIRDKFLTLFADQQDARDWLARHIDMLVMAQHKIATLSSPQGLLHGDLRGDNILKGVDNIIYVIDWPNACYGPLVFDAVFLGAHLIAAGLMPVDQVLGWLDKTHRRDDRIAAAAAISGFFADQAYRTVPERLPRLRWMQKMMLAGALELLAADSLIDSMPRLFTKT